MVITWKKWGLLFLSSVFLFATCHLYAKKKLVPISIYFNSGYVPDLVEWLQVPIPDVEMALRPPPWPTGHWVGKRLSDLKLSIPASTCNAEALMGIALLDPFPHDEYPKDENIDDYKRSWEWSRVWAEQALTQAKDPKTKIGLRQFLLANLITHVWPFSENQKKLKIIEKFKNLFPPPPPSNGTEKKPIKEFLQIASLVDPHNALYSYCQARLETEKILGVPKEDKKKISPKPAKTSIEKNLSRLTSPEPFGFSRLPHAQLKYDLVLQSPDNLVSVAKEIDDILKYVESNQKLRGFAADRSEFIEQAALFYWGPDTKSKIVLFNLNNSPLNSFCDYIYRPLANRLCFIADELAARGQNELALSLYRHAKVLANRLISPEDQITFSGANTAGLDISYSVTYHLLAYWASRSNPEKVMAVQDQLTKLRDQRTNRPYNLLEDQNFNLNHGAPYARAGVLAWWLAMTAIFLVLFSLFRTAVHAVLRRNKFSTPPIHLSRKFFFLGIIIPLAVMLFSAAFFPYNVRSCCGGTRLFDWMVLLFILQIVLLTRFAALTQNTQPHYRSFIKRFLPWLIPGILLVCFAGDYLTGDSNEFPFLPFALLVLCVWLVFLVIKNVYLWIRHRDLAAKTFRARTAKTVSVFALVLANAMLLTAIPILVLTYALQKDYYQAINDYYTIKFIPAITSRPTSRPVKPYFSPSERGPGGLGFSNPTVINDLDGIFQK